MAVRVLAILAMIVSWYGALPDYVCLHGRKIFLSARRAANVDGSEDAADADGDNDSRSGVGTVFGMLKFSIQERYDHFMVLSANEKKQYEFWRRQCPGQHTIEGRLLRCKVEQVSVLPAPVPVQQFTDARPHGLIVEMEEGQPERLFAENQRLSVLCERTHCA